MSDAEQLDRAVRLLWDAHAKIREAYIADDIGPLFDWREGPLVDFLIEYGGLIEILPPDAIDVPDLGHPSDGPNCPRAIGEPVG